MKEITERTLKVENVSLGYGETTIVKDLSLEFPKGKVTAIIGPNGCGKSTLLRGVSRLLKPLNGDFTLDGKPTHEYSMKGFARMVGLMPQHPIAPEGITVADLVSRGRYPYQGLFKRNSAEDDEAVAWALEATTPCPSPNDRSPNSLAANVSASGLPWRSPKKPTSYCWTSRPRTSTWHTRWSYSTYSRTSTSNAAPP